jgi:YVTN family beta-propeller protein
MRQGSAAHKELFCGFLVATHRAWKPEHLAWPELDDVAMVRLLALPFWGEALGTERETAGKISAYAETVRDPILREAIALQGREEERHARLLEVMMERYGLRAEPRPAVGVPDDLEQAFVDAGYGECLDSFFAFGLFEIARGSGFFPEPLLRVIEPIVDEEARHIVFLANWEAYRQADRRPNARVVQAARAVRYYARAVRRRLGAVRSARGEGFTASGATAVAGDLTARAFLETCLKENRPAPRRVGSAPPQAASGPGPGSDRAPRSRRVAGERVSMTGYRGRPRWRWWVAGAVLWGAVAITAATWLVLGRRLDDAPRKAVATEPGTDGLPVLGTLPGFELIERSGRPVKLDDLRGHVWIATFFFSRCQDTCSLQNARLAQLQADLAAMPDVRLVSISVDAEHDTPPVLRRYADGFGADPERWLFLTGDPPGIVRLAQESFRVSLVVASRSGADAAPVLRHSPGLVLVDREARIRGYYHSEDPADVARLRRDVAFAREGAALAQQAPNTPPRTVQTVPGMPPVVDPNNLYSETAAGKLSPAVAHALPRVYVPNRQSNDVYVIDPMTYKVVDRYTVGIHPQHVVPSWDLKTLWVANNAEGRTDGSLTPIDPATGKPGQAVAVDDPYNMYNTPDGRSAVVVAEALRRLDFRDPQTMALQSSLAVPRCAGINHGDFRSTAATRSSPASSAAAW